MDGRLGDLRWRWRVLEVVAAGEMLLRRRRPFFEIRKDSRWRFAAAEADSEDAVAPASSLESRAKKAVVGAADGKLVAMAAAVGAAAASRVLR